MQDRSSWQITWDDILRFDLGAIWIQMLECNGITGLDCTPNEFSCYCCCWFGNMNGSATKFSMANSWNPWFWGTRRKQVSLMEAKHLISQACCSFLVTQPSSQNVLWVGSLVQNTLDILSDHFYFSLMKQSKQQVEKILTTKSCVSFLCFTFVVQVTRGCEKVGPLWLLGRKKLWA